MDGLEVTEVPMLEAAGAGVVAEGAFGGAGRAFVVDEAEVAGLGGAANDREVPNNIVETSVARPNDARSLREVRGLRTAGVYTAPVKHVEQYEWAW